MLTREDLVQLAEPVMDEFGMELVECQIQRGKKSLVRISIDSEAGVSISQCAQISRRIERRLESLDPDNRMIGLEVSSAGMNRPIWNLAHFQRFAGKMISFRLRSPQDGKATYQGSIESVEGDVVSIRVEDGEVLKLKPDEIEKANLDLDPWLGKRNKK